MGPLISMAHRDRVDGFVRRAVDQGANTYLRVLSLVAKNFAQSRCHRKRCAMKIDEIETWRRGLGLFPVPLHHDFEGGPRFVLLNGVRGSFCLDLSGADPDPRDARSVAWSSNVGHYVTLTGDSVVVQPWDQRPGRVDRYTYATALSPRPYTI